MADHTKTISNTIYLFGMSPTSLWGSEVWGDFLWGDGDAGLPLEIGKNFSESITLDSEMISEGLSDGEGWSYVFPSNVTEAEDRTTTSYTSGTAQGTSWSSASVGSVTWS